MWSDLGQANVVLSTLLLGSALQPDLSRAVLGLAAHTRRLCRFPRQSRCQVQALAAAGGRAAAALPRESPRQSPKQGGATRSMEGGEDGPGEAPEDGPGEAPEGGADDGSGQGRAAIAGAVIAIKLLLMPVVCIPLHELGARAGVLPDEPVLLVVLHMMSGLPSSLSLVVLLLSSGQRAVAEQVSALYMPQYAVSILSVAAVTAIAIMLNEDR